MKTSREKPPLLIRIMLALGYLLLLFLAQKLWNSNNYQEIVEKFIREL